MQWPGYLLGRGCVRLKNNRFYHLRACTCQEKLVIHIYIYIYVYTCVALNLEHFTRNEYVFTNVPHQTKTWNTSWSKCFAYNKAARITNILLGPPHGTSWPIRPQGQAPLYILYLCICVHIYTHISIPVVHSHLATNLCGWSSDAPSAIAAPATAATIKTQTKT